MRALLRWATLTESGARILKLKYAIFFSLFSLFSMLALAATPQYSTRKDIVTNLQRLTSIAVADFNGDGKPDIAALDSNSTNLAVYLNQGNGNFSDPVPTVLTITGNGMSFVAGDFNEDGKQDLMVSFRPSTVAFSYMLLAGNGD